MWIFVQTKKTCIDHAHVKHWAWSLSIQANDIQISMRACNKDFLDCLENVCTILLGTQSKNDIAIFEKFYLVIFTYDCISQKSLNLSISLVNTATIVFLHALQVSSNSLVIKVKV